MRRILVVMMIKKVLYRLAKWRVTEGGFYASCAFSWYRERIPLEVIYCYNDEVKIEFRAPRPGIPSTTGFEHHVSKVS